ncbi:MAG: DUF1456 family protein [Gammaproteobacteria bacterium]|nr:DUF1456 family protein [Gammaproteobacteria bacterium]
MTNNYVLRRLRYTLNFNDTKMISICAHVGLEVPVERLQGWLKKDDDPAYIRCSDHEMAQFLNGLIIEKRGKKDDGIPKAEYQLNNNIILRKLKIAFNWIDQDILDLLSSADFNLGKSELSAFFRKPDHRHYRECQDQVLRNVLQGLQMQQTNQSTAQPQSKYQALKSTSENRKEQQKHNKTQGKNKKPFTPKKAEKVVYQNPNFKGNSTQKRQDKTDSRPTLSLKKSEASDTNSSDSANTNDFIWKRNQD